MRLEPYATSVAQIKRRKPLRSAKEMAAEFGISMAQLRGHLGAADAPKPEVVHHNNAYYDPGAFRRWMRGKVVAA